MRTTQAARLTVNKLYDIKRAANAVMPQRAADRQIQVVCKVNKLLSSLPPGVLNRVIPDLKLVTLPCKKVLFESDQPVHDVYFPNDAIVSLCNGTSDGSMAETALIGAEGLVDVAAFMGGRSVSRAVVQISGTAYRIPSSLLKKEFDRYEGFFKQVLRYIQALIAQTAQTAACNRHHSIDQQLCRWLLLFLDRVPNNQLSLTQEAIASMLGVRREGVTDAAGSLQRQGIIEYRRGHITVKNRSELTAHCCECYSVVKNEFDRLIPHSTLSDLEDTTLNLPEKTHS